MGNPVRESTGPAPELREAVQNYFAAFDTWERHFKGHLMGDELSRDLESKRNELRALLATPQPRPPSGTALDLEARILAYLQDALPGRPGSIKSMSREITAIATQPSGEAYG